MKALPHALKNTLYDSLVFSGDICFGSDCFQINKQKKTPLYRIISATVVHCFFRSFYRHAGHHYETGKQFTSRWLPGKDFHSLFFLALFEGCGIGKFGIKHNRLPRNFFRPLNSGDTQFVCPRSRDLINNSLFKDDLLYILALALEPLRAELFKATSIIYQRASLPLR